MGMTFNFATGKNEFHEDAGYTPEYNAAMKSRVEALQAADEKAQAGSTWKQTGPFFGERTGGSTQQGTRGDNQSAAPAAGLEASAPDTPSSSKKTSTTTTTSSGGGPGATSGSTGAGAADSLSGGPAISGLTAALGELSSGGGGATGATLPNTPVGFSGSGLREGMAIRSYPQDTYALAALKKVY